MGVVKTIFFRNIAQLLQVKKNKSCIWATHVYNAIECYSLLYPRYFDEDIIKFINQRTVYKKILLLNCLRLYTTRERLKNANERYFKDFPSKEVKSKTIDAFVGTSGIARKALKEKRLLEDLCLKVGIPAMLLQNMSIRLSWVNGTIVCVVEVDEDNMRLIKFSDNDKEHICIHNTQSTKCNYRLCWDIPRQHVNPRSALRCDVKGQKGL
ncbi:hypothetical protein BD408DRAFT_50327 [Parasitella parasitica]|nr:hypothetical protein BD408DRAFT_50327 [Parasitella parasitica]